MKRFLPTLMCALLLLIYSVAAQATPITIQSQQVPDFRFTGANLTLRIFLNDKGFITSDGFPKQPGSPANGRWYKEVSCSLVGSTLTIASFTIDSTIDGLDTNTATYSAWFYSGNTQLQAYSGFDRFRVPNVIASSSGCLPSGSCATWADLRTYNFARVMVMDNSTYVKSEIDAKIAVAGGVPASSPFILKTAVPGLSGAQVLASLGTGLIKNTTGTGVLSLAVANTDYLLPTGSGASLTNLNAGNLSAGTIPDARFPSVLPAISGLNLTNLNAGNLASGTVPDARFPSVLPAISGLNLTNLNAGNLVSGTIPDLRFPATLPAVSGANLTALNATQLTSGTVPDARFPATLPALNGVNLTALNATNLGSGTLPDARFPSVLPAISGLNLTALNASNLGSGTVPDARFPSVLPALSGVNLTNLNASNLGSGIVPDARLSANVSLLGPTIDLSSSEATGILAAGRFPALTGDITTTSGSLATTLATTIANPHTFSGIMTMIGIPTADPGQSNNNLASIFRGADSTLGTPLSSLDPSVYLQTFRTGGSNGFAQFGFLENFQLTGAGYANTQAHYTINRVSPNLSSAPAGTYFHEGTRNYLLLNPSGVTTQNVIGYALTSQVERSVSGVRIVSFLPEVRNFSADASESTGSIDTSYHMVTSTDGLFHNTGHWLLEGPDPQTSAYFGIKAQANSVAQRGIDFTDMTLLLDGTSSTSILSGTLTGITGIAAQSVTSLTWSGGTVTATTASPHGFSSNNRITIAGANQSGYNGKFTITVTGANTFTYAVASTLVTPATGSITATRPSTRFNVEVKAGDQLNINGVISTVTGVGGPNSLSFTPVAAGNASNLSITKTVQPIWLAPESYISAMNTAGNALYRLIGLKNNVVNLDADGRGITAATNLTLNNNFTNKVTIGAVAGQEAFPGIWFASSAPSLSNYAFLGDVGANKTVLNATSEIDFRIGGASAWEINSNKHLLVVATDNTLDIGQSGAFRPRTAYLGTSVVAPIGSFATSATSPLLYGGTAGSSTLTINGTSNGTPSSAYVSINPQTGTTFPGTVFMGTSNSTSLTAAGFSDVLHLQGENATIPLLTIDSYGSAIGGSLTFRQAKGTAATPAESAIGDTIANFGGRPFYTLNSAGAAQTPAFAAGNRAAITFRTSEAAKSDAQGMYVSLETTPKGSTTRKQTEYIGLDKALTDSSAVSLFEIDMSAAGNKTTAGTVEYCIIADNGTDFQSFSGAVAFTAYNKAGSVAGDIRNLDGSVGSVAKGASSLSGSTTLSAAWSILNGTQKVTIQLNADTSLSSLSTFKVYYKLINNGTTPITLL